MAGELLGMNPEQADNMAGLMDNTADAFTTETQRMSSELQNVQWIGPDANSFREQWASSAVPSINNIVTMLKDRSVLLRKEAEAQRQVSGG